MMHRSLPLLFGLCALLPACQNQASRLEAPERALQVQANVFTASSQGHPSLALGPDGRSAVVWDSKRQEVGSFGVYARVFDAAGQPRSQEIHANLFQRQAQWLPSAAYDAAGDLWLGWESQTQDGSGSGLVARRFDRDGMPLGEELPVNLTREGDQAELVLTAAGERMWAAWTNHQPGAPGLALRRLDTSSAELSFPTPEGMRDRLPSLCALADGHLLLSWTRRLPLSAPDHGRSVVMARLLDADGSPTAAPFALAAELPGEQVEVQCQALHDGGFAAVWMHASEASADHGYGIRLRSFDGDGQARGETVEVAPAVATTTAWLSGAALAVGPDDQLAVAWNHEGGPALEADARQQVWLRRFSTEGRALGDAAPMARAAHLSQHNMAPRLAWTADDRLLLAYEGRADAVGDGSAANLALRLPSGFLAPPARDLGPAQAALSEEADLLAANPPIWDPNWVPQGRLPLAASSGGDFGFEGVPGTGWTPPDPELAVGPQDLLVMTNGAITSLSKSGTVRWTDAIESSFGFWGSLGAGGFVFDPECTWDPHARRFLAMASERTGGRSYFLFAVSKDDSPDNGNDWWKYRLDVTSLAGGDIDSPNMAVGPDSILLTADFFSPVDKYLIYVIDKASVLNGGTPVTTSELITGNSQQSMGVPVVYDNDPTLYILQSTEFSSNNTVIVHAITNPFTAYQRSTFTLSVPTYTYPNQPPQKGSSSRPFLFEPRFWSVAERNGSLWAVHHVNNSRARVRWYEIALNGWPTSGSPSLRQEGEIDLGSGIHTFFPSIHVDANDNVAITFSRSASNEYMSVGRATRAASDPLNTMRPAQVVRTSDNAHTSGRWGDYSGTQAEPDIPGTFWGHHEFTSGGTSSWRTWVARYLMRPAPLELSVPTLQSGSANLISVTGATPGARVFIGYSLSGTGLSPAGNISAVLSLDNPALAAVTTADGLGNASINPFLPGSFSGTTVWLQAAEDGGTTSNWVQRTIL